MKVVVFALERPVSAQRIFRTEAQHRQDGGSRLHLRWPSTLKPGTAGIETLVECNGMMLRVRRRTPALANTNQRSAARPALPAMVTRPSILEIVVTVNCKPNERSTERLNLRALEIGP